MISARPASIEIRLTPLKIVIGILLALLLIVVMLSLIKTMIPCTVDDKWSKPVPMGNGSSLCHWNGTEVVVGGGGVFRIMSEAGEWEEKTVPELAPADKGNCVPLVTDPKGPAAMFLDIRYSSKVDAIQSLVPVTMTPQKKPAAGRGIPLAGDAETFFSNVAKAPGTKRQAYLFCGEGFVDGAEFCIPYAAYSQDATERITSTGTRQTTSTPGPNQRGVLSSADGGRSWQRIDLGQLTAAGHGVISRVGNIDCYLAADFGSHLWMSTKAAASTNWSQPTLLCNTLKMGGPFMAEEAGGTLHLCWMDMRLKKGWGFFIYGDWDIGRKNNQVYYRNYREKDGKWGKEKKLSGSLSYCEHPSMSVEGDRIVVAWHNLGEKRAIGSRASPYMSAAIYYVTSKDAGRTWSRPTKIAHSEDSAGNLPCPQVILHQKVIHVLYNGVYQRREFPG